MNKIDQVRVLLRVARDLLIAETKGNDEYGESSRHNLFGVCLAIETADATLYPFAPDAGEAMLLGGGNSEHFLKKGD
jgi:hypothetical protein